MNYRTHPPCRGRRLILGACPWLLLASPAKNIYSQYLRIYPARRVLGKRVKFDRHDTPIVLIQVSCRSNLTLFVGRNFCQVLHKHISQHDSVRWHSIVELLKLRAWQVCLLNHGAIIHFKITGYLRLATFIG